ncbi:unnamed protein product [Gongylonema pulchrum]|uniref:RBR-type E3 ubiquitin transferase n=1 Tax=Gongylonema pulchrum TaxID=637853 RepID=A0A3P7N1C6_9BILA|nr:unnamed protein product [Gongylonema pulchrum]
MEETMDRVVSALDIPVPLAKLLLQLYKWDYITVLDLYCADSEKLLVDCNIHAGSSKQPLDDRISCMENGCNVICMEDFVLNILKENSDLKEKYEQLRFKDCVESHPKLRFCSGPDCHMIIMAEYSAAKKVTCTKCETSFCFRCGSDYHAPTSCETIRKWLIKCADDSETANYIR